jgi:hypothetical protein
MRVSTQFVSCGVNRVANALDWGDNGLIAYCAHKIVCVYDPEVGPDPCQKVTGPAVACLLLLLLQPLFRL